jgi:hypothetical protein
LWYVNNGGVTVTNPGAQTNAEGNSVSLPITATGPAGQALTYSALGLPAGLTINSSTGVITGTLSYSDAETSGGVYPVVVTVTDSRGDTGSQGFVWTVTDTTQPPVLTVPGNQSNAENTIVSLPVTATDPNGLPLTYSATGLPAGLNIDQATGQISGTIDYSAAEMAGGHYTVHLAVSDGPLAASGTFTWTVTNSDRAPILVNPGTQQNGVGNSVSLPLQASDPDGDPLTFTAANLPPGLTINGTTGLISGTVTGNPATYVVTVTASDGTLSASQTFDWDVSKPMVLLAIRGTQDHSDDILLVNPATPVTVQVTLLNASPGLHQISLSITPSGASTVDQPSFQLVNGGTLTVSLTPVAQSGADDDITLLAMADGQAAGQQKETNADLTITEHITAADTPAGMPDRIPPTVNVLTPVKVTVAPNLGNKQLFLSVKGSTVPANGNAQFNSQGHWDSIKLPPGGSPYTYDIFGVTQTAATAMPGGGNAGHLQVAVELHQGPVLKQSAGFSVAAIPQLWKTSYKDKYALGGNTGIILKDTFQSDSGQVADLDAVDVAEQVKSDQGTGVLVNVVLQVGGYVAATSPLITDSLFAPNAAFQTPGGELVAHQVHVFRDRRTGASNIPVTSSGYKMEYEVFFDPAIDQLKWRLRIKKTGSNETVNTYTSRAGATYPGPGIEKVVDK